MDESVIVEKTKTKKDKAATAATAAAAAARTQERDGDEEMQPGEQVQQQQKQRFLDKYAHLHDAFIDPSLRLESDDDEDEERPAASARAAATPAAAAAKYATPPSQSRPVRRVLLFREDVAGDKDPNATNPDAEDDDVAVTKDPEAPNPAASKDDVAPTEQPKATTSVTSITNDQAAERLQQLQLLLQDDNRDTEEVAREVARLLGMPDVAPRVTDVVRKLREQKIEVKEEINADQGEKQHAVDSVTDVNLNTIQMAGTLAAVLESYNIGDVIDRMVNDRVDKLLEMSDEIAEHIGVLSEEQMIEGVFEGIEATVYQVLNDDNFFAEIFKN